MKNGEVSNGNFSEDHSWITRALILMLIDIVIVNVSFFIALMVRFDFRYTQIPAEYLNHFIRYAPIHTVYSILVFYACRLYHSIWKFASISELGRITLAVIMISIFQVIGTLLFGTRMPISYYVVGIMLEYCLLIGVRFSYRFVRFIYRRNNQYFSADKLSNTMIIGAGEAGRTIARELINSNQLDNRVCCFIDDNPNKHGRRLEGIPIVGNRETILKNVERYKIHNIILAIPTATTEQKRDILQICKMADCKLMTVPGLYQMVKGEVSVNQLREVEIEDLLGRDQIKVNLDEILGYVQNQVVMVTGGGGSIGSELCRQIASHRPKKLIIFDIYENNAYDIEQELKRHYKNEIEAGELEILALIGSVRDIRRIDDIFDTYHPDIVYHAAAHKHVPLMEASPNEAIKNNVFGTYNTALAAGRNGVKRFVLISTDKAVNPTNIMGASKRMCEMIVQTLNKHFDTEFVAVRFGNVLGSNGSVIPLFKRQIKEGGPVTVTHPDIIRYFMTIPEAVSLVLQAGAYAKGGEIFILDMGEPVKIDDLAKNLIRLSGYTPNVDMMIQYTGLRPGEKLYEELLMAEEGMQDTENKMIHIGKPIEMDEEKFMLSLTELKDACNQNADNIKELVSKIVTTYHYQA